MAVAVKCMVVVLKGMFRLAETGPVLRLQGMKACGSE
jgi:hypothetical protein